MRTIGLLLDSLDVFGNDLIAGTMEGLRDSGFRLLCVVGGALRSPLGWEARRNVLYDLVGETFDGLIVSGSLSHYVPDEELARFCQSFFPRPVVTVSVSIPEIASVTCDNTPGLSDLMDHLLVDHKKTRFAFIGGPAGQQEAEIRKGVFLRKTSEAGIDIPSAWMVEGNFSQASGREAAETLFGTCHSPEGTLPFEVVVSANDAMATGALEVFQSRGVRVPEDLLVTGFDGTREWGFCYPPLTTVRQTPGTQACEAARYLVRTLAGENQPFKTLLASTFVIRESCGCRPTPTASESELRSNAREYASQWKLIQQLRELSESLQTSSSFPELLESLSQSLHRVGSRGFWLSLFDDPSRPETTCRLHLASFPGEPTQILPEGLHYPTREWIPGGLANFGASPETLVLEALHSRECLLGFLIVQTDCSGSRIASILRTQISAALQAVLLLEERRRTERQLIQAEKMSSLGSLVNGVAHEINTPLGVAITAASYQLDHVQAFRQESLSDRLTKTAFNEFLDDFSQAGKMVQINLARVSALVDSFKQVSIDQSSENRRVFAVKDYLQMALVGFRSEEKARTKPIKVRIEAEAELVLDSYPWALVHVVTNLLSNSYLHGFPQDSGGTITLGMEDRGESVLFWYADDGLGIAPEILDKIYEPFFTTQRGRGGPGLGLNIVYNQVTGLLGGTITCSSTLGKGTRFDIVLPKVAPARA